VGPTYVPPPLAKLVELIAMKMDLYVDNHKFNLFVQEDESHKLTGYYNLHTLWLKSVRSFPRMQFIFMAYVF